MYFEVLEYLGANVLSRNVDRVELHVQQVQDGGNNLLASTPRTHQHAVGKKGRNRQHFAQSEKLTML